MDKTVPAGAALVLDFIYRTDAEKAPPDCHQVILGNRQSQLSVIPCGVGDAKRGPHLPREGQLLRLPKL